MTVLKVVLDTNVIVSALVFGGKPREVLRLVIEGKLELYLSKEIIDEVLEILGRKFKYPDDKLLVLGNELITLAEVVQPETEVRVVYDDPDDDKIIECAVEAGADFIISGDSHLLNLEKYNAIKILKVTEFLLFLNER